MINNLLIQLIIEKERKKLLIKNTSFRVMKHTTLLPSVYFPSTLVLTFSSWRVRRRCPASLSHLFGRRAASSFTIHENDEDAIEESEKTEPTRTGDGARKKSSKLPTALRCDFFDSSPFLLSLLPLFSPRHSIHYIHMDNGTEWDSGQQQHEWAVNVNGERLSRCCEREKFPAIELETACLLLHAQLCSSSINEWLLKLSSSNH